jgi:nucleotide-binding universal stress UspA family protein
MFSTILVPLDGTPESNAALPVACVVARVARASIWLLRVARYAHLSPDHSVVHAAAESVERIASELAGSGLEVHPVTREGEAAREILHVSQDIRADLIIMRTHGRAGFERAVFGSIAEEVLKATDLPLLLVRPGGKRLTHICKLLVPVDGSADGLLAVPIAETIATATAATINLLQVAVPVPIAAYAAPYDPAGASYYDSVWDDDAVLAAKTYVHELAGRLRQRGHMVDAETRMVRSIPRAIDEAANKTDADLIIMSTHALTGAARTVLGSVADAVVRTSPCPVLLIKHTHGEGGGAAIA